MIEPPTLQAGTLLVALALPCPLRRNRPFWLLGRLNPGKANGLTCCCARSGDKLRLILTTVAVLPLTCVAPTREASLAIATPWRTTLLVRFCVELIFTAPPAWTTALAKLDEPIIVLLKG